MVSLPMFPTLWRGAMSHSILKVKIPEKILSFFHCPYQFHHQLLSGLTPKYNSLYIPFSMFTVTTLLQNYLHPLLGIKE